MTDCNFQSKQSLFSLGIFLYSNTISVSLGIPFLHRLWGQQFGTDSVDRYKLKILFTFSQSIFNVRNQIFKVILLTLANAVLAFVLERVKVDNIPVYQTAEQL